jgi:hypothetical protein
MHSSPSGFRSRSIASIAVLALATPCLAASGNRGLEALAATVPTVSLVAAAAPDDPQQPAADCMQGTPARCYEDLVGARNLNVASFFDRSQRGRAEHFMVKYSAPADAGRHRLEGFSFTANRAATFALLGALVTKRDTPFLPTNESLTGLQRQNVRASGGGEPTCIDFAGQDLVLEADEAAWLVVGWSDAQDTIPVTVRVDPDPANDHPCDFMSRDAGDLWYRPDPAQAPFDWKFTAFYAVMPSKQTVEWNRFKRLYR